MDSVKRIAELENQLNIVLQSYAEAELLYFQYGSAPEGRRYFWSQLREYGLYERYEKAYDAVEEEERNYTEWQEGLKG